MIRMLRAAIGLLAVATLLGGCAGTGTGAGNYPVARDPFEPVNRAVFAFNDSLDEWAIRPAAVAYTKVVPEVLRIAVHSMASNISDLWVAANQLLQGKPALAGSDLLRFAINTTLGVGGLADVATPMGLEKHREDFGQTLGRWGVPPGPYLVAPLFGPSSVRDGLGIWADVVGDPVVRLGTVSERNTYSGIRILDTRAGLLSADGLLRGAALDRYSFVRDGYLQRRRNQVYDGDPPPLKDE